MTVSSMTVEAALTIVPVATVAVVARWWHTKAMAALEQRLQTVEAKAADKVNRLKSQVEALTGELNRQRSSVARLTTEAKARPQPISVVESSQVAMQEPFEPSPRRRPSLGFEDTQIL